MDGAAPGGRVRWDGVAVEVNGPGPGQAGDRPPVVLVHGGCHGPWCWQRWSAVLAGAGWRTFALSWFGRFGSAPLRRDPLRRSLGDLAGVDGELARVLGRLQRPPILIGHSMGAFACLDWASRYGGVAALVLLAPVVPHGFGAEPIPLDLSPDRLWKPPDVRTATSMFFDHLELSDRGHSATARRWTRALVGESPVAVLDAIRFRLPVDVDRVRCAVRIVLGREDPLVPAHAVRALAERMRADLQVLDCGHGIPLHPDRAAADETAAWLSRWC